MLKRKSAHLIAILIEDHAIIDGPTLALDSTKLITRREHGDMQSLLGYGLGRLDDKDIRVPLNEVPIIGAQLVLDLVDETRRTIEAQLLISAQASPQQTVKAREVIHMGVRDKGVAHAKKITRRERRNIAQVEEHRPALKLEFQKQPRIPKGIVDKAGVNERRHFRSPSLGL